MSQPPPPIHDLTVNKVLAGAGAAVTSAVLGSFFGVGGTVVGAAVGSVASMLATTLYERSLDHTRDRIRARLHAGSRGSAGEDGLPDDGVDENGLAEDETTQGRPSRRRRSWVGLLGASVLVFLLGMLVVTGVEWVKGSTVAGEPGTSFGNVLAPASSPTTEPSDTSTPSTTSASVDATEA